MKDHEIAALVNALRDIAIKYHDAQQLRERIAALVVPALAAVLAANQPQPAALPSLRTLTDAECEAIGMEFGPTRLAVNYTTLGRRMVNCVIAALQQSSSGITAGAEKPSQVVDSGAAGPTRTGDLLITNQGAETAETLGNQQDTPSSAPVDGAQAAQGESSTCEGVTAGHGTRIEVSDLSHDSPSVMPTHFCLTCGARWRQLDDGRWNLRSPRCEPCCDNGPTFNVMPLVMAYDALRGQLHDEIAANHAFRDAGGALPDEDMPTFCDRLIRERDAARSCLEGGIGDPPKESPMWRKWAESRHSVQQMREELERLRAENARLIGDHTAALRFVGWLGPRGIFMEDEIYQAWKEHRKDPSAAQYRKVYAAPPVPHVDPDWLSNVIRTVDGNNTMGAGALAEKIADAINGRAK